MLELPRFWNVPEKIFWKFLEVPGKDDKLVVEGTFIISTKLPLFLETCLM